MVRLVLKGEGHALPSWGLILAGTRSSSCQALAGKQTDLFAEREARTQVRESVRAGYTPQRYIFWPPGGFGLGFCYTEATSEV